MARVVVTVPGERVVEEFDALVERKTVPAAAPPPSIGLVEISQRQATELIPGPAGPQGPRGSRWFTGTGPPGAISGQQLGDMYLDDTNDEVWQFDGVAWQDTGTNIHGSPDTGADILAKLITVDGAGSGLDADTLDGHDTAYFDNQIALKAPLASPDLTGTPTAPTAAPGTATTQIASTAFVGAAVAPLAPVASPTFTGDPKAPTPATADNDTSIATTAFVKAQGYIAPDAPSNGNQYVRQNAGWALVSVPPGTAISDTPPSSPVNGQLWWESDTGNLYIWFNDGTSSQWVQINSPGGITVPPQGQCYLTNPSGTLLLQRENGSQLWINGKNETIPAGSVGLAATGVAATTLYWIYAYMAAGVMTLERDSVNGPVVDAASGMRVKTGDATRTFVGAWRSGAAGSWDTNNTRGASWFNPKTKTSFSAASSPATTSTGYVELGAGALRVDTVCLAGRDVKLTFHASPYNSLANADTYTTLGIDGVTGLLPQPLSVRQPATGATSQMPINITMNYQPAEGFHFFTPLGSVSSTNTGTWLNAFMEATILG